MEKKSIALLLAGACFALTASLTSCASTQLAEGEELVEYKNVNYTVYNKKQLTEQELREDCDMLKYVIYNTYAGIDEAISLGFDLDATIEEIYQESLKNKELGYYKAGDFQSTAARIMSKRLTNSDQHLSISGYSIKDSLLLFYSKVYFEKQGEKYFVKKSEEENIKEGMEFTGPENNLFEILTDDGILYRYGVMTTKKLRSALLSVNNETYTVKVENEKAIFTKESWTGLKETKDTLYMSLGDCSQVFGISNNASASDSYWEKYLNNIAKAAAGKKNIIFDLRSNPGGYFQFPAKMLSAAYYNQHMDKEYQNNMQSLFNNKICEGCTMLVSPFTMQSEKEWLEKSVSNQFSLYKPEVVDYFKNYWKHMEYRPIRKHIPLDYFASTFEDFPEPDFKGDVYVLINRGTGSAAEFGTGMTYLLQDKGIKVHLIGENSWGGIKYGGMWSNSMPNSGLWVRAGIYFGESPIVQNNPNWHGEGNGWFPDYWATNETILNTLENLTGDLELKTVLAGLGKELL